jgi:hypothetical protein
MSPATVDDVMCIVVYYVLLCAAAAAAAVVAVCAVLCCALLTFPDHLGRRLVGGVLLDLLHGVSQVLVLGSVVDTLETT